MCDIGHIVIECEIKLFFKQIVYYYKGHYVYIFLIVYITYAHVGKQYIISKLTIWAPIGKNMTQIGNLWTILHLFQQCSLNMFDFIFLHCVVLWIYSNANVHHSQMWCDLRMEDTNRVLKKLKGWNFLTFKLFGFVT